MPRSASRRSAGNAYAREGASGSCSGSDWAGSGSASVGDAGSGRTGLTAADRLLGLAFGLGLGASIVAVAVFLGGFTEMGRTPWWQQSLLVGPFERAAVWGRRFLPENIAKYHQYGPGDMADNQGG